MVPAPYGERCRDTECTGGTDVIGLRGTHHANQRRDEHGVRALLPQEVLNPLTWRQRGVRRAQRASERRACEAALRPGRLAETDGKFGRALFGSRTQARRAVVPRVEIPDIVERQSDPGREPGPLIRLTARRLTKGNR